MKVFQIVDGICHWDATPDFPSLADTEGKFAPDVYLAEAPDYVYEGWGFDYEAEGDARFIQPEAPEGWLYDPVTGCFYREGNDPPAPKPTYDELLTMYAAIEKGMSE